MDIQIVLKEGLGDIHFGCTPEVVRVLFGEPEDVEELENALDGNVESIVWNYPDTGLNFFFDAANGEPILSTIESDNLETVLFNAKIFNITRDNIVSLLSENGYKDVDEDDETWGEHRVTFDDAQVDFYFADQELTLVSWSNR
jgi:spore germination protein YaaH